MKHNFCKISMLSASLILALSSTAYAEQYRCKDNNGKVHYGQTLPYECENIAYDILNNSGIVIERVAPPRSKEEIEAEKEAIQQAELEKKTQLEIKKEKQKFLRMYPTREDIIRSQRLKTEGLNRILEVNTATINSQKKQLEQLKHSAAEQERTGRPVSKSLQSSIKNLRSQIKRQMDFIAVKTKELKELDSKYQKLLQQFDEMTK
ncbi:MAG: DUF4124 domain-containing protein [bacterium]